MGSDGKKEVATVIRIDTGNGLINIYKANVNRKKLQELVTFILKNYEKHDMMTIKELSEDPNCPTKCKKTLRKHLALMQKHGIHGLKTRYSNSREFFKGCNPQETEIIMRESFEGFMGVSVTEFLHKRPLIGRFLLERMYRHKDYGTPIFPRLHGLRAQIRSMLDS